MNKKFIAMGDKIKNANAAGPLEGWGTNVGCARRTTFQGIMH